LRHHVDESGCDRQSPGIDFRLADSFRKIPDGDDGVVLDRDIV
jgi:hypothetical protein